MGVGEGYVVRADDEETAFRAAWEHVKRGGVVLLEPSVRNPEADVWALTVAVYTAEELRMLERLRKPWKRAVNAA